MTAKQDMNRTEIHNIKREDFYFKGTWSGDQAEAEQMIRALCDYEAKGGYTANAAVEVSLFGETGMAARDNTFEGSFMVKLDVKGALRIK